MNSKEHKKRYSSQRKKRSNQRKRKLAEAKRKRKRQARIKQFLLEFSISLFLLVVCLYILSLFTFSLAKVEGYSMTPTLNHGEWVFVNKLAKIKRFKLVLYKDPVSKETSVRRVIGLPKEAVYFKADQLYVNDIDMYERFLATEVQRAKGSNTTFTKDWAPKTTYIPDQKYLVLGDNRPYATDSREYGYIDQKSIVGVVEMRIFPIHLLQQF